MGNRIIVVGIVTFQLILMSFANAQIGIKAGLGISDIAFLKNGQTPYLGYEVDYLEHRIPGLSYQFGVFATFNINERFEFQPEILYAMQGLDYSTTFLYDDITYKLHLGYLKIPLLVKYRMGIRNRSKSAISAGPYFAYLTKASRTTRFGNQTENNKVTNIRDLDFGLVLAYSFRLADIPGPLHSEVRIEYSLVNIMDPLDNYRPWYYGPGKEYARNINFTLNIGYRFLNLFKDKKS